MNYFNNLIPAESIVFYCLFNMFIFCSLRRVYSYSLKLVSFVYSQLSSSLECDRGVHGQDMHTELEMYASRLAEAEQRQRAMSTPDLLVFLLLG